MEKSIVVTGKTIEIAIDSALQQLGLDRDSVSVQVLAQAKSGFLGFGASPAKIQVTYEAPDPVPEAPKVALSSASRSKPKTSPVSEKKPEAPKPEKRAEAPRAEVSEAPRTEKPAEAPRADRRNDRPVRTEKPRQPRESAEPREPKAPVVPKVYTPAEPGSVEEKIETFLRGLLDNMGSQAVPHAMKGEENTYQVELTGENLGFLIGRRGETLDAIQHLCNYAVNRKVEGHIRINVDAEQYREKREESLCRYARKKAQQVLKARRRTTLEPMNAYERHVIHATLQDMDNITTYSTGTEPNRRVVIEYVR